MRFVAERASKGAGVFIFLSFFVLVIILLGDILVPVVLVYNLMSKCFPKKKKKEPVQHCVGTVCTRAQG